MSGDPLSAIEDRRGQIDLGVFGYRIYQGAREEGETRYEALAVTAAWYLAMVKNAGETG